MSAVCQLSFPSQATSSGGTQLNSHGDLCTQRLRLGAAFRIPVAGTGDLASPALAVKAPAGAPLNPCGHITRSNDNQVERAVLLCTYRHIGEQP